MRLGSLVILSMDLPVFVLCCCLGSVIRIDGGIGCAPFLGARDLRIAEREPVIL
jgi:hypothetical protein